MPKSETRNEELDKLILDQIMETLEMEYEDGDIEGPMLNTIREFLAHNSSDDSAQQISTIRSVIGSFESAAEDMMERIGEAESKARAVFFSRPCKACKNRGWFLDNDPVYGHRIIGCHKCKKLTAGDAVKQAVEDLSDYLEVKE